MENNLEKILNDLNTLTQNGNEKEIENFLTENFSKLPEETQRIIISSLLEQGIKDSLARNIISALKKDDAVTEICEKIKQEIEK